MKAHFLYTNIFCQKPILRQIVWGVENGSIINNWLLLLITSFFLKIYFVYEPLINSWLNVTITQMYIFILFESASVRSSHPEVFCRKGVLEKRDAGTGVLLWILRIF